MIKIDPNLQQWFLLSPKIYLKFLFLTRSFASRFLLPYAIVFNDIFCRLFRATQYGLKIRLKSGAQETRPNFQIWSLSPFQSIPATLSRRSVENKFIERSGLLPHLQSGARNPNYSEIRRNAIFKLEIFRMSFSTGGLSVIYEADRRGDERINQSLFVFGEEIEGNL